MTPRVAFEHERSVALARAERGSTLLDLAVKHGIPLMHACGGKARCSTCRVRVLEHGANLSPRTPDEAALAVEKGLPDDVRLACQSRVTGPVTVRRLVIDAEDAELAAPSTGRPVAREARLAILMSDIRSFTPFAAAHLPYDVIHILNRYFRTMGEAVYAHGGAIDKYMGDGLMALFGLDGGEPQGHCLNAVRAGLAMLDGLERVNAYLREHFETEFRIGIGIASGEVLIGEMGHPRSRQLTAIGDAVNLASRIEGATKRTGASLLISAGVREAVKGAVRVGRRFETELAGKSGLHVLHEVVGLRRGTRGQGPGPRDQ
ncbi:MAG: adenylate/guanylate cyclase domain-containing protein [Planctomycetes bacterium]|nr:adenylate/guanylate cyclase domain-containing protein [Planctomycetota bacterium]